MDDLGEVFASGDQLSYRRSVLGVEELVRQDVAEPSVPVQQLQAALDEDDVDVVVALARGAVRFFVVLDLDGSELL